MRNTERKAKVTPETQEESRKLRAIWDATENRPSQAVFAELHDIGSQTAVATFLKGTTPISKKAAKGFAIGLNCKIEDFSPRIAAEIASMTAYTEDSSEILKRYEKSTEKVKAAIDELTSLPPEEADKLATILESIRATYAKKN